jgi:hypothetical protein
MKDGDVFEGETFLDLVSAMKGATMFSEVKNVIEYIAVVQRRAREMEKIDLDVTGEKIDDRCESLVRELARVGFADLETAAAEPIPMARLVRMYADILCEGDVMRAWTLVRASVRLSRREQRRIEQELGIGKV